MAYGPLARLQAAAFALWPMAQENRVNMCRLLPSAIGNKPYAIPVVLAASLLMGWPSVSDGATRIAVLPFQNVSGHLEAPRIIMPIISKAVQDRGYEVVELNSLEPFLFRHRIRATEKIRRDHLVELGKELGVPLALVGSVDLFADTPGNPQWGISGRLLATDSGGILWAGAAGFTGDDFTGFLGLGTVTFPDRLAELAVDRMFTDFPSGGVKAEPARSAQAVRSRKIPGRIFRDPQLDTEPPRRVAVLPFENGTERRGAALIVDDLMVAGLFRVGRFDVVDPGEVLHALQTLAVAPYGGIDLDSLRRIGEALDADAVILGRVEDYNEGLRPGTSTSPSIALDARMLETKTGKILWMGYHEGLGEEYQIVLDFGKIKSMVPLAMRIIADLAETM